MATRTGSRARLCYNSLSGYFDQRLRPAPRALLDNATAAGVVRLDIDADELLGAVASLCLSSRNDGSGRAERMVALLVDGMRVGVGGWNGDRQTEARGR